MDKNMLYLRAIKQRITKGSLRLNAYAEEVGHGPKGIMVGRISESRTLFYRGHEINMAGF